MAIAPLVTVTRRCGAAVVVALVVVVVVVALVVVVTVVVVVACFVVVDLGGAFGGITGLLAVVDVVDEVSKGVTVPSSGS